MDLWHFLTVLAVVEGCVTLLFVVAYAPDYFIERRRMKKKLQSKKDKS